MPESNEPTTQRRNPVLTPELEQNLKDAYAAWMVLNRCIKIIREECEKNADGLPF